MAMVQRLIPEPRTGLGVPIPGSASSSSSHWEMSHVQDDIMSPSASQLQRLLFGPLTMALIEGRTQRFWPKGKTESSLPFGIYSYSCLTTLSDFYCLNRTKQHYCGLLYVQSGCRHRMVRSKLGFAGESSDGLINPFITTSAAFTLVYMHISILPLLCIARDIRSCHY